MGESRAMKRLVSGTMLALAFGLAACSQEGSTVTAPHVIELAAQPAPIDVSGTWRWSEEAKGLIPEELALELFGIQPEGRATHFTCHDEGTFTLVQDGSSFTGSLEQTGICFTRGGQVIINDSPGAFPVLDGRVRGRSVHFDFSFPECPYTGVLTVEGDIAVAMNGTGKCGPFGPRDHFKAVSWEATRVGG